MNTETASSDLRRQFAGARIFRPASAEGQSGLAQLSDPTRLYVLVDDGDGGAERVAANLRARGMRRVAILTGGELILERGGQAGTRTRGLEDER